MQEHIRQAYLEAMGVTVWSERSALPISTQCDKASIAHGGDDKKNDAVNVTEPYHLTSTELEPWLLEQCLLKIYVGDVGVNTIGDESAKLLVLSQCMIKDKLTHQPFMGKSGTLLKAMLRAIGHSFSSVLLGELDTHNAQGKALSEHLAAKSLKVILLLLDLPRQHPASELNKFRQKDFIFPNTDIKVVVSYHPDYLLDHVQAKACAWQDLKKVREYIKEE
jgi:uracil-DNA glycosylase